jgi:hypothetical protein
LGALGAALISPALARTVKVTLGGIDGEFCPHRALVFEDPNGTRILYDRAAPWPARGPAARQDRHHSRKATCRRPCGQRAQQGAQLGRLHDKPDTSVSAMLTQRSEHRAGQEVKIVTGSDAGVLRGQAGQRRRPGQLDPRALRRQ